MYLQDSRQRDSHSSWLSLAVMWPSPEAPGPADADLLSRGEWQCSESLEEVCCTGDGVYEDVWHLAREFAHRSESGAV